MVTLNAVSRPIMDYFTPNNCFNYKTDSQSENSYKDEDLLNKNSYKNEDVAKDEFNSKPKKRGRPRKKGFKHKNTLEKETSVTATDDREFNFSSISEKRSPSPHTHETHSIEPKHSNETDTLQHAKTDEDFENNQEVERKPLTRSTATYEKVAEAISVDEEIESHQFSTNDNNHNGSSVERMDVDIIETTVKIESMDVDQNSPNTASDDINSSETGFVTGMYIFIKP